MQGDAALIASIFFSFSLRANSGSKRTAAAGDFYGGGEIRQKTGGFYFLLRCGGAGRNCCRWDVGVNVAAVVVLAGVAAGVVGVAAGVAGVAAGVAGGTADGEQRGC
ncbi:hypothetical protein J5N97_026145 [Dioscorea zingiberensis]|uniref:Uncharacterized protein n=1 Tax=Dioscorea zingiberensis TaxID=325984 RepID=A0A9D5C2M9_9LILI|nr:hypothetical protein J5N97_026145 [Dioscorea zingiberensis]